MSYAADHAGALADLTQAGASVTFAWPVPGSYDAATDTFAAGTTQTLAASCIRLEGSPRKYLDLGLTQTEAVTLFCAGATFGALPALGASVTFGGATYTVRWVDPLAPDGSAIAFTAVVAR